MRDTFVKTLLGEAKKDPNIILMTGDLGFGVLDDFQKELPNQFINSGVNEQTMMGLAGGYASTGKRVFVYSIGNFPTLRCLEQIRNDCCFCRSWLRIRKSGLHASCLRRCCSTSCLAKYGCNCPRRSCRDCWNNQTSSRNKISFLLKIRQK